MAYHTRLIDQYLKEWSSRPDHKPLLLRGARQVGKSTAIRHLGEMFNNFVEINFEKSPSYSTVFQDNLDVERIIQVLSALSGKPIIPGKTLLFFDEIQSCPRALMSLRFFKEDMPELHVVAAGSLLEFALEDLPTFGVGRIHSMFMYPMTFDEFLIANGEQLLLNIRNTSSVARPLPEPLHLRLVELLRAYILVGGMPEVVDKWVETHDYLKCSELQDDIVVSYQDDFPKYHKRIDPLLLRHTLRSVAAQAACKFVYSQVGDYRSADVKKALEMLILAGLVVPVTRTAANGLPLGSEEDTSYRKMLLLDTGIMLRLLKMSVGDIKELTQTILTAEPAELVNKGPMAEMLVGLEMLRYSTPNIRHELHYWVRLAKNSLAEIDYVASRDSKVLPIEVKSGTQGGMKSLWLFMREKKLSEGIRCSLENFGAIEYFDTENNNTRRVADIIPIYAISMLKATV
ncbi:MAG: ATP-binding protein [Muribaculaceae bacterium]|nr:ATP-binding protein [Muribaculaceae bacterium]